MLNKMFAGVMTLFLLLTVFSTAVIFNGESVELEREGSENQVIESDRDITETVLDGEKDELTKEGSSVDHSASQDTRNLDSISQDDEYALLFGQNPISGTAATSTFCSENDIDYEVTDNFWGISGSSGSIRRIVVYGLSLYHDGDGWVEDPPDPAEPFTVSFYAGDGEGDPGEPDWDDPEEEFEVDAATAEVGSAGDYDLYEYEMEFPSSVDMEEGWVSVRLDNDSSTSDAWFLWLNSICGDHQALQRTDDPSEDNAVDDLFYDLSLGLFGDTVETRSASDITLTSLDLNGYLFTANDQSAQVHFEYRKVGDAWSETTPTTQSGPGDFSHEITGLEPLEKYEFKAVVEIDGKEIVGDILVFTPADISMTTQMKEEWAENHTMDSVETDLHDLVIQKEEDEIYNVPGESITVDVTGIDTIEVKMWGAGGGGMGDFGAAGGSGGFIEATLDISTFDEIEIWVGEGGEWDGSIGSGAYSDGGWGRHHGGGASAGPGGGSTEIVAGDGTFLAAADAGGGGGTTWVGGMEYGGGGGARGGEGGEGSAGDGNNSEGTGFGGDGGDALEGGEGQPGEDGGQEVADAYLIGDATEVEGGGSPEDSDGLIEIEYPYEDEGERISEPLFIGGIENAGESVIYWNSEEPSGTDIKIYTAVTDDEDPPAESDWIEADNGDSIPDIEEDRYLWTKQVLTTSEPFVTPHLQDLTVAVLESEYGVNVEAPADSVEDEAGMHTYYFDVENTGNEEDTYELTVEETEGWTATVQNTVTVGAEEVESVDVDVTIPADAGGETSTVTLSAVSQEDTSVEDSDFMDVTLNAVHDFSVNIDDITAGEQPYIEIDNAEYDDGSSVEGDREVEMNIDDTTHTEILYFSAGGSDYTWDSMPERGTYTADVTIDEVTRDHEFTVDEDEPDSVSVETQPEETEAGQMISGFPVVYVEDAYENPVEGVSVTVSEAGGYPFDSGTTTQETGDDGLAIFDDLVIETAGTYELVFDAAGVAGEVTSDEFDVIPAGADHIEIEPEDSTVTAGETKVYSSTSFDVYGNEIGDVTEDTVWEIDEEAGGGWTDNEYTSEVPGTWTVTGTYTHGEELTAETTLTVEPDEHTLTIAIEGEGHTEPAEGTHTYDHGEEVVVEALSDEGWYFVEWTGDHESTSREIILTMESDMTVTAHFNELEEDEHTLTIEVEGGGTTDPSPGTHTYAEGEEVSVEAIEDVDDWYFSHWSGDVRENETEEEAITVVMDEDKEVTAHFEAAAAEYELTIEAGEGGTTEPEPGVYAHEEGTEVVVEAIPDEDYYFVRWTGDHESREKEITVTMDGDKELMADFEQVGEDERLLTIQREGEGTTDPEPGGHVHEEGEEVTIEAIPYDGWTFSHWSGDIDDAQREEDEITVSVEEDMVVTAHFEEVDIWVEILSPEDGYVFGVSQVEVEWDSHNADRHEVRLSEGGWIDVGEETAYTFEDMDDGIHTVELRGSGMGTYVFDSINVTVDTIPPELEILSPEPGERFTESDVMIEWEASDEVSGILYIELRIDDGDWIYMEDETSYRFEDLDEGEYNLHVKAVDRAGNEAEEEVSFTVEFEEDPPSLAERTFGSYWILLIIPLIIISLLLLLFTRWRDEEDEVTRKETIPRLEKKEMKGYERSGVKETDQSEWISEKPVMEKKEEDIGVDSERKDDVVTHGRRQAEIPTKEDPREGTGPSIAAGRPDDEEKKKCPECGSEMYEDETDCSECGHLFEGEEQITILEDEIFTECEECGFLMVEGEDECPYCERPSKSDEVRKGLGFIEEEESEVILSSSFSNSESDKICPECEVSLSQDQEICHKCGHILEEE